MKHESIMKFWSADEDAIIRDLWAKGLSARTIATEIGTRLRISRTRNSVIGRLARLKLARGICAKDGRPKGNRVLGSNRKITISNQYLFGRKATNEADKIREPIRYETDQFELYVKPTNRRKLVDLEDNQCRWPMGEPNSPHFHFCDQTKVVGASYCLHHVQAAYIKLPLRVKMPLEPPTFAQDGQTQDFGGGVATGENASQGANLEGVE